MIMHNIHSFGLRLTRLARFFRAGALRGLGAACSPKYAAVAGESCTVPCVREPWHNLPDLVRHEQVITGATICRLRFEPKSLAGLTT